MCESAAYIKTKDGETLLMEEVAHIDFAKDKIVLSGILGDRKEVKGRVDQIDFMNHKIMIVED